MAREDKGIVKINVNDIVGTKVGRLEVKMYHNHWYDKTAGGDRFRHSYLCKCECGNYLIIRRQCLLNKTTKSCGCIKKGRPKKK